VGCLQRWTPEATEKGDELRHKRRRFKLSIDLENAAFVGPTGLLEIAKLLRQAAAGLETGEWGSSFRDGNGNTVGNYGIYRETVE
jgi:hypothetical protein